MHVGWQKGCGRARTRVSIALVSCSVQTNQLSFVHESCVLLEVGNDIGALLGVGDTGEGHSVTGGVISWGLQVFVEGAVGPLLAGDGLESGGVGEAFLGGGGSTVGTLQVGASAVGGHGVADSAKRLEELLTLAGVSFNLLLGIK